MFLWVHLCAADDYINKRSGILMIIVGQAKGLLSDYQPKYNSARAVYRERKKYVDEIDWNMLAVPPTGSYKASSSFLLRLFVVIHLEMYIT